MVYNADIGSQQTVIGHRGSGTGKHPSGVRENTIPSFEMAFKEGADEIEMDLALTADEVIVLAHDEFIISKRKKIFIQDTSFAEIKKIHPDVPSLEEVLNRFPRGTFTAELKLHTRWDRIVDVMNEKGYLSSHARMKFISFNPEALMKVKTANPQIYCSLIATAAEPRLSPFVTSKHIEWCLSHHIEEIAGHVWLFTERMINRTHEAGLLAGLGQIDSERGLRKAIRCNVRRLYTNRIGWLTASLNRNLHVNKTR